MGAGIFDVESFWDDVLSGEPERTRNALAGLDADERQAVIRHLQRMTSEEGWHPLQQRSAQAALDALAEEE